MPAPPVTRRMILQCPECNTRYLVPDSVIGADGRTVRCAQCRHSWFQDAAPLDLAGAATPLAAPTSPVDPVAPAAGPLPDPIAEPAPPPTPTVAPADVLVAPRAAPSRRPRRNPARRWTMAAVAAGLLMLIAAGAILWSGAPGLAAQLGLPIGPAESPLMLHSKIERRELENGSELFAVAGRVNNPTAERQRIPDLRADLRDATCRLVFSWVIVPQQRSIAPGGALDFNSAKLDVPPNSKLFELSFVDSAQPAQQSRCGLPAGA